MRSDMVKEVMRFCGARLWERWEKWFTLTRLYCTQDRDTWPVLHRESLNEMGISGILWGKMKLFQSYQRDDWTRIIGEQEDAWRQNAHRRHEVGMVEEAAYVDTAECLEEIRLAVFGKSFCGFGSSTVRRRALGAITLAMRDLAAAEEGDSWTQALETRRCGKRRGRQATARQAVGTAEKGTGTESLAEITESCAELPAQPTRKRARPFKQPVPLLANSPPKRRAGLRDGTYVNYAEMDDYLDDDPVQAKSLPGRESEGVGVAPSRLPGAGDGLFARKRFSVGQTVCTYEGETITAKVAGTSDSKYIWMSSDETVVIDAWEVHSCHGRYVNDPCNEHMDNVKICVLATGKVVLVAIREIGEHEEFYTSYGIQYWEQSKDIPEDLRGRAVASYKKQARKRLRTGETRRAERSAAPSKHGVGAARKRPVGARSSVVVDSTIVIDESMCVDVTGIGDDWGDVG